MPQAFVAAFDLHRARLLRACAFRTVFVALLLAAALYLHHWAAWVAFGVLAFVMVPGVFALLYSQRHVGRERVAYQKDISRLAWVHIAPEPRTKFHRVELHDREGETTFLFVLAPVAERVLEGVRALEHRPTITTSDAERAPVEARVRLDGKLVKLEREAREAEAPRLRGLAPEVEGLLSAFRARDDRDAIAAEMETRVDKLLHLYTCSRSVEKSRSERATLSAEKNLPEEIFARELFTDDVAEILVETSALVRSRGESAPAEP